MNELHRTLGILDLNVLGNSKLVLVGLGSLGSLTLANLCYPFKEVVLIDPDILEDKNIERHLLGPEEIGESKVMGCWRWMKSRGVYPKKITACHGRVEDILMKHADADVVILSVDNPDTKYFVNNFCATFQTPLIMGGIYPLGDGGEVTVITDYDRGCLCCVEHQLGRDAYMGKSVDYGLGTDSVKSAIVGLQAVPALRGPVSEIAAVISSVVLDIVQGKAVENHIYLRARSWTPVINTSDHSLLKILSEYINIQDRIGLYPNCPTFYLEMHHSVR
ncbi:MAG: hypothetical protein UW41_C0029G0015 [Candidatus Collierbacteria bacterium GW2011_GWC2_44_18]|uniref:THIF-type NAD/FAD binding fold domain-containing protein n=1 Tax=Candidatus Collierbacteria bacterium GW2011_GWC2_44_18 TaxID=1618392 RepID=A0A0G1HP62_9BACT|nr:MAG: hypothetical protein UW41_C0029G0015 [Candidatus Collierbacteria bacterium GW2011_GWC2_44_18]